VYAWPLVKDMTPAALIKNVLAIVAAVSLVIAFMPPAGVVVTPTEKHKVSEALSAATKQDRSRVRAYYTAMADVVRRDDHIITTVGRWRTANANALDLAFKGTDLPGKYKGLDTAIEDVLVKAIGKEDVAMTAEKRAALVVALEEVASAAR
jgi:hypothetical protein